VSDTIFERHINHIRACGIEELVAIVGFGLEKLENLQETTMVLDADTNTL
jgi:CTP:phosphocholine cytidylyltransferase-like protein